MADGFASLAFLGVERSLTGRRWRWRPAEPGLVRAHQQQLGLDCNRRKRPYSLTPLGSRTWTGRLKS